MKIEGVVGLTSASAGAKPALRQDTDGSLFVKDVSPGLAEAAIAGRLFHYATQGEVANCTELNVTFTGLGLGNPATSGKNYILHEFGYAYSTVVTNETDLALSVGVIGAMDAAQTPQPSMVGGGFTSSAYLSETCTRTAPLKAKFITSLDDMVAAKDYACAPQIVDLKGTIVLAPGYAVWTETTAATGTVMYYHFIWEEVDA